jgi:hypothetical protein
MPIKNHTKQIKNIFFLLFFISVNADAAFNDSRTGKWAFFLAPMVTNSKVLQFDNGAEAAINKRSGLGLGFGYNLNHHIELSVIFSASSANYTGTRIADNPSNTTEKFTSNLYTSKVDLGFTYNLLSSALTPYISANIGTTYIDSGIPTGDIGTICWWDPWWGYICSPTVQTYTSTEFNYGAGIGLRYDFNRKLYIKGGVAKNIIDINSRNTADFTTYQLIFGFMF